MYTVQYTILYKYIYIYTVHSIYIQYIYIVHMAVICVCKNINVHTVHKRMHLEYCDPTAAAVTRLGMETSLRSDVFALQKLASYADGKLILWSWASRGLISLEWIADLQFKGDVEAATEALSQVKGELAKLCHFDTLPMIDGLNETEPPTSAMLEGEVLQYWAISDPSIESESIPLPLWMRGSIDKAVLKWRTMAAKWEERIAKRQLEGKTTLAPKQKKAYDEFIATNTRSIVLDKVKHAEVVNIAAKSVNKLKKTCLLLVVHMSDDSEQLRMTTGCGKLWKLQLLQQSKPLSDIIPEEVDHFSGLMV